MSQIKKKEKNQQNAGENTPVHDPMGSAVSTISTKFFIDVNFDDLFGSKYYCTLKGVSSFEGLCALLTDTSPTGLRTLFKQYDITYRVETTISGDGVKVNSIVFEGNAAKAVNAAAKEMNSIIETLSGRYRKHHQVRYM